jgi:hypothetical protein
VDTNELTTTDNYFDLDKLKANADENDVITDVITVGVDDLLRFIDERFLDYISERLTDTRILTDIDYTPVKVDEHGTIHLRVSGSITDIVDAYENELKGYA